MAIEVNERIRVEWIAYIEDLQDRICAGLEHADSLAKFHEDRWTREGGGGGRTRVIGNGAVFEKGGVNTSVVFGDVTQPMRDQLRINGDRWFACGLSLVLHPQNPFVPTIHCNYRMFELEDHEGSVTDRWFGGGADLTPYYLFDEDAIHFHRTHKQACDLSDPSLFPQFKKECDSYFVNHHRNGERRGIGGIFFDHCRPDEERNVKFWFDLARGCGDSFLPSYLPIVERRRGMRFDPEHKYWQEIRRGRYTEFNLVHDRGTLFGLRTNGRTESILMSLPPTVRFDYDHRPEKGSEEERLLNVCLHPRDWV